MVKISTSIHFALFLSFLGAPRAFAKTNSPLLGISSYSLQQDTSKKQISKSTATTDTIGQMVKSLQKFRNIHDTLNTKLSNAVPNLSLQQIVKGNLAGVYVQEPNGEPGTEQGMIIRGASGIVFSKRDFYAQQPAVYLNGVPLVADNPFAFDIQKYDFNRIGPATNLLSQINIDNVESISIVKDPYELAKLGPNASNGAIYITTKNAKAGIKDISLNSYFGYVAAPTVNTINGAYLSDFRKPFYEKYGTADAYGSYPAYLSDSTNNAYFGASNWDKLYYNTSPTYSADLGIRGGTDRANFSFFGSGTKNAGNADNTNLNRYNAFFAINMAPFKWLTVSSAVNAARLDRDRNSSLRDRYAEARYIPDLSNPLAPNADTYNAYLTEVDKKVDRNRTNIINGNLTLSAKVSKVSITSSLMFDYNEGIRDYFTPSTLMDGVSYISNYYGYSQRMLMNNTASYDWKINQKHQISFEAGQSLQGDTFKYNYARAYNGPNDYIKLNFVDGNPDATDYLNTIGAGGFYVFRYIDKQQSNLLSFYGSAKYQFSNLLTLSAILRRDGASNGQPDSRWVTTPAFDATWNLKNQFLHNGSFFNDLKISAGWGRTVRLLLDDKYAAGPQYNSYNGWSEEPTIPGYGGKLGINRPYNTGFVGYGITLPYAERAHLTLDGSILKDRLSAQLSFYNREDRDQTIGIPVPAESGYAIDYKTGLNVNNKGAELVLNGAILTKPKGLTWTTSLNFNYNKNKVTALPNGLKTLTSGNDRLEVGKSVGSFWLYSNNGIYDANSPVPAGMTFNDIPMKEGDPKWVDYNGDNKIDDNDKVMSGDRLPKIVGGWNNQFSYKNFDLSFNFIYALGQKALNQYEATRYGFVSAESGNDIRSIKEISSWQVFANEKQYPIYNPWSAVDAYRIDQDLFLENASYLKLRSVTLGYDFAKAPFFGPGKKMRRAYLYATAMNLFTITKFTGVDPELVNYNGYYDGANLPIPTTFVLGFKLDL